jgi:FixJ family two-component response regulator
MTTPDAKTEKTILAWVVDDEPDMLQLASLILVGFGWKIETFEIASACLEREEWGLA